MDSTRPNQPNTWRTQPCFRKGFSWLFMCEKPLRNEQYYNYGKCVIHYNLIKFITASGLVTIGYTAIAR